MDRKKIAVLLKEKEVPGCCTGSLGYAIGHLYDHGLTDEEVRDVVDFLLNGIKNVRANPEAMSALLSGIKQIAASI